MESPSASIRPERFDSKRLSAYYEMMIFNAESYSPKGTAYRILPSVFTALLMGTALLDFAFHFGWGNAEDRLILPLSALLASSFYLTFYILFALSWVCVQTACFSNSTVLNSVLMFLSGIFYSVAVYSIQGFFMLKLCIASAILLASGLRIKMPANAVVSFVLFLVLVRPPLDALFLGESLIRLPERGYTLPEKTAFAVFLFLVSAGSVSLRAFALSALRSREIIRHLNKSISQISKINQELQDTARKAGEEAAAVERNRISRDIHDISGYIFTNIISLMDAGMSTGGENREIVEEIFQTTRTQAREGLQETRRALHTLRENGYEGPKGINAIYRIKQVFENITGVEIQIDPGNIPNHFTNDIDRMMYCTVQEALTNSRRHGRATRVRISFWMNNGMLQITVTDNGTGARSIVKGIGLSGMEERIAPFGGMLETTNPADGGFRLDIRVPVPEERQGESTDGKQR